MSDGKLKFVITIDDKGTPIIKDMAGNIQKIEKTTVSATKKMSKGFGSMWKQMALGQVAFAAMRKVTRLFSSELGKIKDDLLGFDTEFQNVTTLLDKGEEVTFDMKNEIISLAGALGSTTELTQGLYQALSASVEPAKAVEFVGKAAKFAKAGLMDMTTSVDVLTTILNAYGMSAEKVTYISDVLFQTIKDGKITGQQLAQSLGTVIPTAAQMGVGIEEITAAVATLTKVGIDAKTSVVALNQTLLAILKPTEAATIAAKKMGIELSKAGMEKAGGFQKYLMLLKEKLQGNTKAMAEMFPNTRALRATLNLAGSQAEVFANQMERVKDVSENTNKAFDKQMKGYKAMAEAIRNELSAAFQKKLMPALEKVKIYITENKDKIIEFGKKAIAAIMDFGGKVVDLIKILYQFKDVIIAVGEAMIVLWSVKKINIFATALSALSVKMMAQGSSVKTLGAGVGKLGTGLKKAGAMGAAAFIGWKIGEAISDVTGLSAKMRELNEQDAIWIENREKENLSEHTATTARYVEQIRALAKENKIASGSFMNQAVAIGKNKEIYEKLNPEMKKFVDKFSKHNKEVEVYNTAQLKLKKAEEDRLARLKKKTESEKIATEATKKATKEIEYMDVAFLSQIDQLKLLDIALSLTGQSYTGLSVNLQEVTKKTNDFELSMLSEVDQLNIASGVAQMMGLSLLGINIPMVDLSKNTKKAATDSEKLAAKLELIANAASSLKGLLNELGIETGGVADGFVDLASGAATLAAGIAAKDPATVIAGITQALKGLLEILKSRGIEQAIERENKWMGMNDSLKESLKELAKEMGSVHAATSTMLVDIMDQSEITVDNFERWALRVREVFSDLVDGTLTEAQVIKTMGENFSKLIAEAQRLDIEGSRGILDIIGDMESRGLKIAEISEYRIGQLKNTAQALQDYALAGGKNIESYSSSLFAMLQKEGVGLTEIAEIMGSNMPAGLRKFIDENENALNVISSTQKMMEGLGNSGYLTQEIFNKMQGDIIRAYDSMTEGGKNQEQSLRAVAPALAKELWYAQQYNYTLDAKTQKMIDDARAAGINLDNMKTQQQLQTEMNHSLKQLVDVMEEFVGATRAGNNELSDMATTARGINFNPGDIPRGGSKGGIPEFAEGGHFWVDKPMYIKVGEKTREEVIIRPEGKNMGGDNIGTKIVQVILPNITNINAVKDIRYAIEHDGEFRGVVASAGDN